MSCFNKRQLASPIDFHTQSAVLVEYIKKMQSHIDIQFLKEGTPGAGDPRYAPFTL